MDEKKAVTYSTIILAAVAIAFALRAMKSVMVPFVLALFLFYIFSPITDLLRRRLRVPHAVAVALSLAGAVAVLFLVTMTAASSIETMVANYEKYGNNVTKAIQATGEFFEVDPEKLEDFKTIWREVKNDPRANEFMVRTASGLPSFLSNVALVLVFFGYLISGRRRTTSPFLRKVALTVNRYLVIKVAVSLATGSLVWLILTLLGLQLAFVFGLCAFALNFIPSVGSMIATLVPMPVAIAQFGVSGQVLLVLLLPGTVQFIIGNVVEPLIQGEGLDLHPITVLLSLIFWFTIWGVPGALIAAPLTSVIRIFLRQSEWGQPIANLLSGRI